MDCPACGAELTTTGIADPSLEVCCGGCGGVWFDNHELEKVDERHESAGEARLEVERARSFARALRFVLPSFWSPGDQPWGAC